MAWKFWRRFNDFCCPCFKLLGRGQSTSLLYTLLFQHTCCNDYPNNKTKSKSGSLCAIFLLTLITQVAPDTEPELVETAACFKRWNEELWNTLGSRFFLCLVCQGCWTHQQLSALFLQASSVVRSLPVRERGPDRLGDKGNRSGRSTWSLVVGFCSKITQVFQVLQRHVHWGQRHFGGLGGLARIWK